MRMLRVLLLSLAVPSVALAQHDMPQGTAKPVTIEPGLGIGLREFMPNGRGAGRCRECHCQQCRGGASGHLFPHHFVRDESW